jgi:hypothetical protein
MTKRKVELMSEQANYGKRWYDRDPILKEALELLRLSTDEQKEQAKSINIPVDKSKASILDEPDKAIILGLIMLLKSEGADEMLIMALMYILS